MKRVGSDQGIVPFKSEEDDSPEFIEEEGQKSIRSLSSSAVKRAGFSVEQEIDKRDQ